jgi:hypothetical protein
MYIYVCVCVRVCVCALASHDVRDALPLHSHYRAVTEQFQTVSENYNPRKRGLQELDGKTKGARWGTPAGQKCKGNALVELIILAPMMDTRPL